jgi:hypothetical protein
MKHLSVCLTPVVSGGTPQFGYIGLILFELVRTLLHGMTVSRLSAVVSDWFLFEHTIHGLVFFTMSTPLRFEGGDWALLAYRALLHDITSLSDYQSEDLAFLFC